MHFASAIRLLPALRASSGPHRIACGLVHPGSSPQQVIIVVVLGELLEVGTVEGGRADWGCH